MFSSVRLNVKLLVILADVLNKNNRVQNNAEFCLRAPGFKKHRSFKHGKMLSG